jgi:hypothetical protein
MVSVLFILDQRSFRYYPVMGRPLRTVADGLIEHALNRGNKRQNVFCGDDDCRAFPEVLARPLRVGLVTDAGHYPRRKWVHTPLTQREVQGLRQTVSTGRPYGQPEWIDEGAR